MQRIFCVFGVHIDLRPKENDWQWPLETSLESEVKCMADGKMI